MPIFGTSCCARRPLQGGLYQRQDAIKPMPCELNDFIQEEFKHQNPMNQMTRLTYGILDH